MAYTCSYWRLKCREVLLFSRGQKWSLFDYHRYDRYSVSINDSKWKMKINSILKGQVGPKLYISDSTTTNWRRNIWLAVFNFWRCWCGLFKCSLKRCSSFAEVLEHSSRTLTVCDRKLGDASRKWRVLKTALRKNHTICRFNSIKLESALHSMETAKHLSRLFSAKLAEQIYVN